MAVFWDANLLGWLHDWVPFRCNHPPPPCPFAYWKQQLCKVWPHGKCKKLKRANKYTFQASAHITSSLYTGQDKSYSQIWDPGAGKYTLPLEGERKVIWQRAWMCVSNIGMFEELETNESIFYNFFSNSWPCSWSWITVGKGSMEHMEPPWGIMFISTPSTPLTLISGVSLGLTSLLYWLYIHWQTHLKNNSDFTGYAPIGVM